jgi:hypothetical protein
MNWHSRGQKLISRVMYHWGWCKSLWWLLVFSAFAALVSGVIYTILGWQQLSTSQQAVFYASDFLYMVASYEVLFLLLNLMGAGLYISLLAAVVQWMGKNGLMPMALGYARAWRLVLVTATLPLIFVLVFGQLLHMSLMLALVLMLVHGLWLRSIDIPAEPQED